MRLMMIVLTTLLTLMTVTTSPAGASELPFTSVQCGDHWFKVHALIDESTSSAVVWYSGDSVEGHANMEGTVAVDGTDVVITYLEGSPATSMQLVVDTFDAMHDLFWGAWGKASALSNMGLCDAE